MFLSRNKKINVYPCEPQFYYINVGFKGVKLYRHCFRDNDKTNATDGTTDAQTKKNCNRGTALKRSVEKLLREGGGWKGA